MSYISSLNFTQWTHWQSLRDKSLSIAQTLGSGVANTLSRVQNLPSAVLESTNHIANVAYSTWRTKNITFQITRASIPAMYQATKSNIKSPKKVAAQSIVNISKRVLANSQNIDYISRIGAAKLDLKQFLDSESYMSMYLKPEFSKYFVSAIKEFFCQNREYGIVTETVLILTKEIFSPIILLAAFFKGLVTYIIDKIFRSNLDKYITRQFNNACEKVVTEEFLQKFLVRFAEKLSKLKNTSYNPTEISVDLSGESIDLLALSSELDEKFESNLNKEVKQISNKLSSFLSNLDSENANFLDKLVYKIFSKQWSAFFLSDISNASELILKKESDMDDTLFHNLLNSLLNTDISDFNLLCANKELISQPKHLSKSKTISSAFNQLPKANKIKLIQRKRKALALIESFSRFNSQMFLAVLSAADEAFKMEKVSEEAFIDTVGGLPNALNPSLINTANEALKEMTTTTFSLADNFPAPIRQLLNFTTIDGARQILQENMASTVFTNQKETIAKYLNSSFKILHQQCNDKKVRQEDKNELDRIKKLYNDTFTNLSQIISPIKRAVGALNPF